MTPNYKEEIKKTGFILENNIVKLLKSFSWNIISNKYYEDDVGEAVREIDVLAYKVSLIDELLVYTTLIISCKKSDDHAWALVCRDIDLNEPNSDWWPLHMWSNDKPIRDVLASKGFNKEYYKYMYEENSVDILAPPSVDVFAFQQMNKTNGKPQNDKNIFTSITTLMKAQSYEMGALNTRKQNKCVYQFNLLSVIDSDLIKLHICQDGEIQQSHINSEQMVTRYIISKREQFFRIRFVKAEAFNSYISSFNELHKNNIELIKNKRTNWLKDSVKSYSKIALLEKDFLSEIISEIHSSSKRELSFKDIQNSFLMTWDISHKKLRFYVTEDMSINEMLNNSKTLKEKIQHTLIKFFNYQDDFYFSDDSLPF